MPSVFDLFDEYAAAYARGERPSAEEYLDRADPDRAQLASLLDAFLARLPVHAPSEDDVRFLGLMLADEPPLLTLRVERGLRVDDVVGALVERLDLEPAKRSKVKRYYQRLEGGLLDPTRLSRRLRAEATLAELLGAGADVALSWTAPPPASAPAYLRLAEPLAAVPAAPASRAVEEDEIDRLFMGGE